MVEMKKVVAMVVVAVDRVLQFSGCGLGDGFWKSGFCDCFRRTIVRCMLCGFGCGISDM